MFNGQNSWIQMLPIWKIFEESLLYYTLKTWNIKIILTNFLKLNNNQFYKVSEQNVSKIVRDPWVVYKRNRSGVLRRANQSPFLTFLTEG